MAVNRLLAQIDDLRTPDNAEGPAQPRESGTPDARLWVPDPADERIDAAPAISGRLLVVDDNRTNRDLLRRRLERQGHTVSVAENGKQALAMLKEHAFDLVLLDILMPEMDGYQVLERIKADSTLRHVPVIMLSALDELESVVRCIALGADDYLHKPFNSVLLRARICACLEKKRMRDKEVLYLNQIEAEKHRCDELLHVILPPPIVTELKETNSVEPRCYDNVAVLFCDIVGFTDYCRERQPEEVVTSLQNLFEVFENLATQHGIEEIKTIGDAFMATAGLLSPMDNPALNCVRCGLKMLAAARSLPPQWSVRIGVHVGPVIAGVVGHRKFLFDLWGDTVNTAAHLESHGINDAVVVSEAVWRQVSSHCEGRSLGSMALKGRRYLPVYHITCVKSPAELG